MSGTNQFLTFATGVGANVLTPTAYEALTTLLSQGFSTGIADTQTCNTVFRQGTWGSAVLGQIIADTGVNANDDGDLATFKTNLIAALSASIGGFGAGYLPLAGGASMTGLFNLSGPATSSLEPVTYAQMSAALAGISGSGGYVWGGITGTLSAQSDLNAALNGKAALAGNSSQQFNVATATTANNAVTYAQMNSALSGLSVPQMTFGSVGSVVVALCTSTTAVNPGDTKGGSSLYPADSAGNVNYPGGTLSGTWRCLGYCPGTLTAAGGGANVTLWQRTV